MEYLQLFKMPKPMKITGRSSSITNSFINSIIPVVVPTNEEVKEALNILGMALEKFECSYCGATATEWDHLRPLVLNKKPTGYISEIHNLVPSCGKCNQSKGNKPWHSWILSDAKLSPKTRGIADLDKRIEALQKYEKWQTPTKLDFETLAGTEKWQQHWKNWETVQETMKQAQVLASEINTIVAQSYKAL
ncbi:HNH endonuclease [Paraferrimonas haliotis]|uniref:HNH domain-containing protein n=1 Tax=Paraferrimonas haliotis TaxID=2013866 RepID=A0AA37TMI8_9GAMM|nr:HNH endonuclease [Paraferrimonas haliotis]GLS84314.1 hypothetical protein GCM10007894_22910 [Paraferrimonas haliotis]